ncbi:hypothetical protein MJG53_019880 [Ovis ammon polii x Ovis aries]|uniref:Uncharacterized protein n=2 Tax=Ovis TaxID=9935 RepID=A0A836CSE5_SHEEP|nr:hypothetical protein JEQ12_020187 [Ovis aries]KAI4554581.1 hypothetical protein MJG53_019880 [Ovis ammon polii x Ovis aries]
MVVTNVASTMTVAVELKKGGGLAIVEEDRDWRWLLDLSELGTRRRDAGASYCPLVCQEALNDLQMEDVSGATVNGPLVHNDSISFRLGAPLLAHCRPGDILQVAGSRYQETHRPPVGVF